MTEKKPDLAFVTAKWESGKDGTLWRLREAAKQLTKRLVGRVTVKYRAASTQILRAAVEEALAQSLQDDVVLGDICTTEYLVNYAEKRLVERGFKFREAK